MAEKSLDDVIKEWREELSGFLKEMFQFSDIEDPLYNLKRLSTMGARARYFQTVSSRSGNRTMKNFHYDEVVPFLEEVDFQYRTWSRIGSLAKDEWEMTQK